MTVADTEYFIEQCRQAWIGSERRAYALVRIPEERPVGILEARRSGHALELGYVLSRAEWGQGLMPEAIGALVKQAQSDPALALVEAFVDVGNSASARALEKSGFTRAERLEHWRVHPNIEPAARACYRYVRMR